MLLVIPTKPLAQKRHRHTKSSNGNVWAYDPLAREKVHVKRVIDSALSSQLPNYQVPEFPDILFRFYMPIPKSMSRKDKEISEDEKLRHCVKPDVDNMVKFYLDCMVGCALKDDRAVKILGANKMYSPHPRVEIEITEGLAIEPSKSVSLYAFPDSVICETPEYDIKDIPTFREQARY